ncbi:ATPase [Microbacterium sp. 179-B 1A2 NHS]|uniref:ATPase n=1 Tax=Microbacterium sp. 179-B 1A2 NHS TaxID=3142383 RepID=UPI0039A22334
MKNLFWFVLGIAGGFVAAHLVNKDPRGQELLAEVDLRIAEFTDRIADSYRAQEAKIEGLVAGTTSSAPGTAPASADAAADAGPARTAD